MSTDQARDGPRLDVQANQHICLILSPCLEETLRAYRLCCSTKGVLFIMEAGNLSCWAEHCGHRTVFLSLCVCALLLLSQGWEKSQVYILAYFGTLLN